MRNFAANEAEGQILLFCDADDEVSGNWVQAYVDALGDKKILAGGLIEAYSADGTFYPDFFPRGLIQTNYLPHVGNCNCAINRSLFFSIGGYDESLPRYGFEDVDFSWRVQEAGYPIVFVETACIQFRISGTSASFKKKFLLGQGRVLMAMRYPQYDSASYSLGYCMKKIIRFSSSFVKHLLGNRSIARRDASQLVASLGNLYGSFLYRGRGKRTEPRLLVIEEM